MNGGALKSVGVVAGHRPALRGRGLPCLHLGPHQTWVTVLVRVKPGFQHAEQFFPLFLGQLLFIAGADLHSFAGGHFGTNSNEIQSLSPGLARSDYPGWAINKSINPERVESIPHIPFVEFDFVTAQQLPELVLKRNLAMMFLLPGDVFAHGLNLRKADGENAVAVLPCEIREVG